jgi:hypothetical protein
MRPQIFLLSLASGALGSVLGLGKCFNDNCARAVTGTRYPSAVQSQHRADCSSFMIITVTPPAPYTYSHPQGDSIRTLTELCRVTTITTTATSYSVIGSNVKRAAAGGLVECGNLDHLHKIFTTTSAPIAAQQVTVSPSVVPSYATACKGPSRYSSACSCAGITQATSYAPTPVRAPLSYWKSPG